MIKKEGCSGVKKRTTEEARPSDPFQRIRRQRMNPKRGRIRGGQTRKTLLISSTKRKEKMIAGEERKQGGSQVPKK